MGTSGPHLIPQVRKYAQECSPDFLKRSIIVGHVVGADPRGKVVFALYLFCL